MLKNQIIIGLALIAVAVWVVLRIRDKKQSNNNESDLEE
ncbi:MAG TPA: FeoB-associated Cys-rich membrane protein [Tenuifilaceae bacterium]|nr:FeoB-associated Cys-rich membrane protein [Tenuifilaceae bacterium]HPE19339.1 FeoB-associated Cys-rich membrane protein [Tenuifilaceae bacterium]HPJ44453.1 FeoB-associated Cys-rich membrane protein [Tenuifilaceae bacterium]HPQ35335.1 FeoB-associated Cys-rich membrane protein [Tenuifilaceae bacterium]HRX69078.1 FeoB-associated Cys-rich membrane protein [Tenuifilaceae bacterium]